MARPRLPIGTHGAITALTLARPLTVDELRQIIDAIDLTTVIGIRDAAMILLGYASALRRAELVALTLADIDDQPTGLLLTIRQSKMDQEGHGAHVAVARGRHPATDPATDPVAALTAWRRLRGETPGALFTRLWGSTISQQPLAAHSLRAGHATTAALAGVPLDRIAAQTRHKDLRAGQSLRPPR